jgi:hypothetical protein
VQDQLEFPCTGEAIGGHFNPYNYGHLRVKPVVCILKIKLAVCSKESRIDGNS